MFGLIKRKPTATARHILVKDKNVCQQLKQDIENGADFAAIARKHSTCSSGKSGGSLGSFKAGQMVKAFDKVVFSQALFQVHGPVKTKFGYHLIEITERHTPE